MKGTVKKTTKLSGSILAGVFLLTGCATINSNKTSSIPSSATVLVMPSHDVVQKGIPHRAGKGSGKQLQRSVQHELEMISNYEVISFKANSVLNHQTQITKDKAIEESKKIGADYSLILNLGEFRNAAPMTFRSDFVTLQSGYLIDTETKKSIWTLEQPFVLEKTNIGNHIGLIDDIARSVAKSITQD